MLGGECTFVDIRKKKCVCVNTDNKKKKSVRVYQYYEIICVCLLVNICIGISKRRKLLRTETNKGSKYVQKLYLKSQTDNCSILNTHHSDRQSYKLASS